jgi:hypothetical protein
MELTANLMSLELRRLEDAIRDLTKTYIIIKVNVSINTKGTMAELKKSIQNIIPPSFRLHETVAIV